MPTGVLPLVPVLLNLRGVLDVHAPPKATNSTISIVAVVRSVYGVNLISAVQGFVGGCNKGMVR